MEHLYEFSAYHGIFLSVVILISKYGKSISNRLISLAVLFFSFTLIEWTSYDDLILEYPHLALFSNPFLYAIAPLIWLYVLSYTRWTNKVPLRFQLLALLPSFLYMVGTYRYYLLSGPDKIDFLYNNRLDEVFYGPEQIYPVAYLIITFMFMAFTYREFGKAQVMEKVGELRIKWLRVITIAYLAFAFIGFCGWVFNHYVFASNVVYNITLICQVLIIQGSGYIAIIKPTFFESSNRSSTHEKYQKSTLNDQKVNDLSNNLKALVEEKKSYLNMDLSPAEIAEELGITKHQLSQVLSQKVGLTFNEFINKYRVEAAQEMIRSENGTSYKLIHLAFDSGFNNKTTFLRNFKKITGLTPSAYREQLKNDLNKA